MLVEIKLSEQLVLAIYDRIILTKKLTPNDKPYDVNYRRY